MRTRERGYRGQTDVWLTPRPIIEALGPFDLDPCAAPDPRPWATAREHWCREDCDGLARAWRGRVWLNPPYGPQTPRWLERMAGHAGGGIALVFARTETVWFQDLVLARAEAVLFPRGRVRFCTPDGRQADTAQAPSCLAAYGAWAAARLRCSRIAGTLVRAAR